ncbi:hypothetical protein F7731_15205 [Cytobacillus depressus]|uniref:Uncharacterized protein n=1 Tax=Cytobacillus depressus TaxID=1602942 RepID=A0A6L3V3G9_9BACI|nr:DUF5316 family protein [Cytobacillus depressus]KAB2334548.1 hypothetical protein F7731_15205 [Cytobacillus depressus]
MAQFFFIVSVVCIAISGVFIGAWTDGQQQRANFHTETDNDRKIRTKVGLYSGLAGLVFLGMAIFIYFLS